MAKRRRSNNYKFTEKTHSKKGIAALVLSILLEGLYAVVIAMSFYTGGSLSMYYGSIGVFAILFSLTAFILAVQSMREENSFRLFPRAALIVSLVTLFSWGGTYAIGFI